MSAAHRAVVAAVVLLAGLGSACSPTAPPAPATQPGVVLYTSVDEAFARPILAAFERAAGIRVYPVFDTEAGKTTGLVERLRAEAHRPRADVWWSSEVFGTIELANRGVLESCRPDAAADLPDRFRAADGRWTAFGLRGRVIAFDPRRTPHEAVPRAWLDLTDPRFKGRVALANPLFGTTRGHMAVLLHAWGEPKFRRFLEQLASKDVRIAAGNAHSVQLLECGQVDMAVTDTDDVLVCQRRGALIEMVYPDVGPGAESPGTLWIPNSVALVAGAPNRAGGERLLAFLAGPRVEELLAQSDSANVPVRPDLRARLGIAPPAAYQADYAAAAALLPRSDRLCREMLLR